MAKYMSMETLKYLLFEVHQFEDLLENERFQDYDKDALDILLRSAKDFSDQYLFPVFKEMDEEPAHYKDGKIIVHPSLKEILRVGSENGWIGSTFDHDDGGMQLPKTIAMGAMHIMESANNHVPGYFGLTSGAAGLINAFGSKELKGTYVPNMIAGTWMGTMALTEPQAGSSLSDITTTAYPQADGTYKIKGQKIFISGGDHEYAENFIHLTLARIEGAPAGIKGISLFVVPKLRIKGDGGLEGNDVITAGDFQKMGQRGYCTTHLVYGENENCVGHLVGNEHMGLRYMFQMMNGARLDVGLTAISTATAAFYASLQYAKERPQGRKLISGGRKDVSKGQTLIINHPDVRRMLYLQQTVVEGSLSLIIECGILEDIIDVSEGDTKTDAHLLLELLTPIAKTYPSEMGRVSINNGLQILGGYGFTSDFILQQYYRDIRIMALYEGTT
ncbi:MAG: acyl-CoA dehydrogenase family protein, partial [Bacteroidia bacterium]|nr:acyl-CoA dehydrogenase family protein [Bacteroidia bacterium]